MSDHEGPLESVESAMTIGGVDVAAGEVRKVSLRAARLPTGTWAAIQLVVIRGRRAGPTVFLSGAIHGDELVGVMAVRAIIPHLDPETLEGTVIAAPMVNVFGLLTGSRNLPDGRDLNRSFPGGETGSLARRMAHLFIREVVRRSNYGIDFHSAAQGRTNLPQLRADLRDPVVCDMVRAFGAPIALHARLRDGSLRQVSRDLGVKVLLFESGEALRHDPGGVAIAVDGTLRVLSHLGILKGVPSSASPPTRLAWRSSWLRASRSGLVELRVGLGDSVQEGQTVARVMAVLGDEATEIRAKNAGVVVGVATRPLLHRGDAVVHIAAQASEENDDADELQDSP